ncbi:MAG: hypothetical protein Q8R16_03015 [bacterium]|nr:hypothetical protein [bacterium]
MPRKLSWSVRNVNRRQRREDTPDIPKPLQGRDLTGFRLEYWFHAMDYSVVGPRYFRNRPAAVRDAKDRKLTTTDVIRVRVITSDGKRGWAIDVGGANEYVRTHRTRAAEREARVARRVRAARAAAPAVPAAA